MPIPQQTTETDSLTGGFEYDFEGDGFFGRGGWQLNGYYQTGETDVASDPARRHPPRSHLPRGRRRHGPSQRSAGLQRHGDHTRYCQPALSRLRAVEPLRPRPGLAAAVDWVTGLRAGRADQRPRLPVGDREHAAQLCLRTRTSKESSISSRTSGKSPRTASLPRAGPVRSPWPSAMVFARNPSSRSSRSAPAAMSTPIRGIAPSWPTTRPSAFAVCRAERWPPETPSRFSSRTCRSRAVSKT